MGGHVTDGTDVDAIRTADRKVVQVVAARSEADRLPALAVRRVGDEDDGGGDRRAVGCTDAAPDGGARDRLTMDRSSGDAEPDGCESDEPHGVTSEDSRPAGAKPCALR